MIAMARPDWCAFHCFYHADRNWLLTQFVQPVTSSLLADGHIDSFFFVRYSLGGPHVRLRLRPTRGSQAVVEEAVTLAANKFFERWPSESTLDENMIRQHNQVLLAADPNEDDDSVYHDNTLRAFLFRPEINRYGGPDLIDHSIDFFAFSSLWSLRFLADYGSEPWSRQLPLALRLIARSSLSFAEDVDDLFGIIEHPVVSWGKPMEKICHRGDQVFEQRREVFLRLLRNEIEAIVKESPRADAEAARRLAWEIRKASTPTRRRIVTSQIHMSSNRLGLKGSDEVYLGRLLSRAVRELATSDARLWHCLCDLLEHRATIPPNPGEHLKDLLSLTARSCA